MKQPNGSLLQAVTCDFFVGVFGFFFSDGTAGSGLIRGHSFTEILPFWLISIQIGVCLHELGHAIACKLAGGSVQYVQLGWRTGERKPWEFRLAGFNWHIYSLPFSGATNGLILSAENYRARQCFFLAGGPLANLTLLIPATLLLNFVQSDLWYSILLGWITANASLLIVSVIPMTFYNNGGPMANDALLFWQTLHYTDEDVRSFVKYSELFQPAGLESTAASKMTLPALLNKHHAEPSNISVLATLVNKLHVLNDPRYLEFLLKLVGTPGLNDEHKIELIDAYLTWQLHRGPSDQPEATDRLSKLLMEMGDSVTVRGTRGSVLIDLGHTEEGETMLKDVLAHTTSTVDKTYANIFLALAAKQRGDLVLAREYAATAVKIDPGAQALKRISDLLSR